MLLSLALTALLLALRGGIVSIMSTPEEAVQGTLAYLTVCFIGIPFITAYNIIASIFRGLGDSKSPMYFIAVACVVNIALDYYFMGTLHLGPAGAALGTTLSQAVSVLVSLAVILKRRLISVRRADFRPQRAVMGKLLQIGVPVALQDGFIQVSFVIITIIANRRGLTDAPPSASSKRSSASSSSSRRRCSRPSRRSARRISARASPSARVSRCATPR